MAGRCCPGQDEGGWETMKDDMIIPRFADPPAEYDNRYFANLNLQLYQFLVEMMSQGPTAVGEFRIDTTIPTSSTGLEAGRVFVDTGTLKLVIAVVLFDVAAGSELEATAAVGAVTVTTS